MGTRLDPVRLYRDNAARFGSQNLFAAVDNRFHDRLYVLLTDINYLTMTMEQIVRAFLMVALATFGLTASAHAAVVLDQSYLLTAPGAYGDFSNDKGFRRAETFTVGVAGILSEVDIFTLDQPTFTGFNILNVAGTTPTTTVLTTGTVASQSATVSAFNVSLAVTVGEVLAIEPVATAGFWLVNNPATYNLGGDFFINPVFGINSFQIDTSVDDFQTFVTIPSAVPEPVTLALLALPLGVTGLLSIRVRREDDA